MTGATPVWGPHFSETFGRLVLVCINAEFTEKWRIFQHFSRTTRFAFFCTFGIFFLNLRVEKAWKTRSKLRNSAIVFKVFATNLVYFAIFQIRYFSMRF